MPELPETETIARDLDSAIRGATIVSVEVTRSDILRGVSAAQLTKRTAGAAFTRVWRRAKMVVLDLSSGEHVVVQPRFTGALLIDDGSLDPRERQFSTLAFTLDDGRRIHYRDIRRLGTVSLMSAKSFAEYVGRLGVEPLDAAFTVDALEALLGRSRQVVKKVLMDQRVIAGIGNIYAAESLWRARIDPSRAARSVTRDEASLLHAAIVGVLTESIAARGTSFRDYRDARGERGSFVEHLAAYGRAGEPCLRCGARLIGTDAIDGRMTVLCARCQS
jgi:formamidopyrimidine-DNA glycosylase